MLWFAAVTLKDKILLPGAAALQNKTVQRHSLKPLLGVVIWAVQVSVGVDAHKVNIWALALQQPVTAFVVSTEGVLVLPKAVNCTNSFCSQQQKVS
jgi:hypothetical protein